MNKTQPRKLKSMEENNLETIVLNNIGIELMISFRPLGWKMGWTPVPGCLLGYVKEQLFHRTGGLCD